MLACWIQLDKKPIKHWRTCLKSDFSFRIVDPVIPSDSNCQLLHCDKVIPSTWCKTYIFWLSIVVAIIDSAHLRAMLIH